LALITVAISLQQYFLADREFWDAMRPQYNNYLIFKYSFSHLIDGLNLYDIHIEDHGDYFKYSPTFAMFMGLFYFLPNWLGLILWNLLNAIVLYFGIRLLPSIAEKNKIFILLFVLFELIGNLQNEQSNALMAGLILLSFNSFEHKKPQYASLFIVLGIYIKLFALVAVALFFLYPKKIKFIIYFLIWSMILGLLPLLILSPSQLIEQYINWFNILVSDHNTRHGFSVLGIIHQWFGLDPSKMLIITIGVILFCLAYLKTDLFKTYVFRLFFLSSILIWVILFNHTAESSGYILAMTGSGIWYIAQKKTILNTVLIILAFVVVSLFSTDIMPANIRNEFVYPYYIRTIPVLLIWFKLMYDMLFQLKSTD
jgi:hypothetical protein